MIEYFDFEGVLTERSPKNNPRPFGKTEAYFIKNGVRTNNDKFEAKAAREQKNNDVRLKRAEKYKAQTDPLILEIFAMNIVGQDTSEKIKIFSEAYKKIKSELPMAK